MPSPSRLQAPAGLVVCVLALGAVACGEADGSGAGAAAPEERGWHVDGRAIRDPLGRQRILHGINVSNDVKPAPHDSWAVAEDYARLQTWGYSAIRLLTGWAAIMPTEGVIDEEYLERYGERIDMAEDHGLAVIIDMHQDLFGEPFGGNGAPRWACDEALYEAHVPMSPWWINYASPPLNECYDRLWASEELQGRFVEALVAVAARFGERDHVVGFDLLNEPHPGGVDPVVFHRDVLQPLYERAMAAVREVAPGKLFFVEASALLTALGNEPAFEPFAGDDVVYAPHYYHPGVHDMLRYDGDPTPIQDALARFDATARRLGVPWLLGELGGLTDSVNFDLYMRTLMGELDRYGVGDTYWEYSRNDGSFAPLTSAGTGKSVVLDAHARVYPKAVQGALVEYAFDALGGALTMTVSTEDAIVADVDAGPAATLGLPVGWQYPDGYVVESTDPEGAWSFEEVAEASELVVRLDPERAEHTITVRPADGCARPAGQASPPVLDAYGGDTRVALDATGFFRTEQICGRWWFVTPAGHPFWSVGVNSATPDGDQGQDSGERPYGAAVDARYADDAAWADATVQRLRSWSFNTAGAWCTTGLLTERMPSAIIANLSGGDWQTGAVADWWDPAWEQAVLNRIADRVAPWADEPNVLGWFLDNEIRWGRDWRGTDSLLQEYLTLAADAPGKAAAVRLLLAEGGGEAGIAELLGLDAADATQAALLARTAGWAALDRRERADRLTKAFVAKAAERYFSFTVAALREAAPHHLILGNREVSVTTPAEVFVAAARHIDVLSINNYEFVEGVAQTAMELSGALDPANGFAGLRTLPGVADLPILITEFGFRAADTELPSTWPPIYPTLPDQHARAAAFSAYARRHHAIPWIVGYHWFQWDDQPPDGRFDGENNNFGLVNLADDPYAVLTAAMTRVNREVWRFLRVPS